MYRVFSQPADGFFGSHLFQALSRDNYTHFRTLTVLAAYAKQSGVLRLRPALTKFLAKGGTAIFAIGVGQGNTSADALDELRRLGVQLYVFHDNNPSQTFHPKMYVLHRPNESAWVSVGSSNLTGGGLFSNYEINSLSEFDLRDPEQNKILDAVSASVAPYFDPESACVKRVNKEALSQLEENGYVVTEAVARKNYKKFSRDLRARKALFGTYPLTVPTPPVIGDQAVVAAQTKSMEIIGEGFWKRLSNYDASKKSSPGQIQIPIRFLAKFPPLSEPEAMESGATQSEVFFDVLLLENGRPTIIVKNTRAILYEPAPTHKRPNNELRFTFRNHEILNRLSPNDVLVFRPTDDANTWFQMELVKEANSKQFSGRFGAIP